MICVLLITVFSSNLAHSAGAYATTAALTNFTVSNIRCPSLFKSAHEAVVPWHRLLHKGRSVCARFYFTFLKRSSSWKRRRAENAFTAKRYHLFSGSSGRHHTQDHDPTKCVSPPPRAWSKTSEPHWEAARGHGCLEAPLGAMIKAQLKCAKCLCH